MSHHEEAIRKVLTLLRKINEKKGGGNDANKRKP